MGNQQFIITIDNMDNRQQLIIDNQLVSIYYIYIYIYIYIYG